MKEECENGKLKTKVSKSVHQFTCFIKNTYFSIIFQCSFAVYVVTWCYFTVLKIAFRANYYFCCLFTLCLRLRKT